MSSPLLIQGSSPLSVLPYSLSTFWKFKILTLSVNNAQTGGPPVFPPSLGSCPDTQVKTLVAFPSSSCYLLLRVCQTLSFFFLRVCQTLSAHHPPRLLEVRVCQTLKTLISQFCRTDRSIFRQQLHSVNVQGCHVLDFPASPTCLHQLTRVCVPRVVFLPISASRFPSKSHSK